MAKSDNLRPQATLAALAYAILVAIAAASPMTDPSGKPVTLAARIFGTILALIPAIVAVYAINCMVTGGCNKLAWFYAGMLAVWTVLVVSVMFFAKAKATEHMTPLHSAAKKAVLNARGKVMDVKKSLNQYRKN